MELSEYVRIIAQRGWIVAVLIVLAAGAAYVFSERQTPIYEASANLSVRPATADQDLGQAVASLLRSLAGDIPTRAFLQQAIERARLETITADALMSGRRLLIEPEPAGFTIAITVRDPDPHTAVVAANAIAELFVVQREEWNQLQVRENRIAVQIRDPAQNAGLYAPRTRLYVAAGGFLGAVGSALIVAVLEWRAAAMVNAARDVERLEIPLLGIIPPPARRRR
jgi:uncharacterized protein involved in exopolysaccharide biosynthesis